MGNAVNNKKTQAALLNELSARQKQPSRKPKCDPTEVKDGTLEELIMGMKSEPYRANDAMRKSVRRNTDRLMSNSSNSRNYDEAFDLGREQVPWSHDRKVTISMS